MTSVERRFAGDVLGDDEQRPLRALHLLEQRDELLQAVDLVLVDEDPGLLQLHDHVVGIGDEVGAEVAAVELHALDHVDVGLQALAFFNGDDAVLADLVEGVGHDLADRHVVVRRDGGDVGDLALAGDGTRKLRDLLDGGVDAGLHPPHQLVGVGAGGHAAEALLEEGLGKHGRRGGPVSGLVAGFARRFLHQLRTEVLGLLAQLDLLGHGHAVLGDGRAAQDLSMMAERPRGPSGT